MAKNTAKTVLLVVLVLSLLIGVAGCGSPVYYQPPPNADNTSPNDTPQVTHPPVTISLDYFGVKSTHIPVIAIAQWRVQFYAVVSDGKKTETFNFPQDGQGVSMNDFNLEDMRGQIIFDTDSVGDYLSISIVAYSSQDSAQAQAVLNAFKAFNPSFGTLADFYSKLPQQKELIGIYENKWIKAQNWGIAASTCKEDNRDLSVWFRIWSGTEPSRIAKPEFKPDVKIEAVTPPFNAKPGFLTYPITLSLVNGEQLDVTIYWQADSSITGKFDSGTATIPKNGRLDIRKYYFWETGNRTITYSVYDKNKNTLLDTRSVTLNITP